MALKRRIKFLKKAFSRIPALVAETENMTAICVVLEREMIFRHDLVHGRKTNVTGPNDGPVSHLARPINPNEPLGEELADSITSAMLEKHYNELGHAGICSMGIGRFVLNIVRQQYLSN